MPERDTFGAGGWRDEILRKVVESQRTPKLKQRRKNVFGLLDPPALTNRERKTKRSLKKNILIQPSGNKPKKMEGEGDAGRRDNLEKPSRHSGCELQLLLGANQS